MIFFHADTFFCFKINERGSTDLFNLKIRIKEIGILFRAVKDLLLCSNIFFEIITDLNGKKLCL